MGIPKDLIDFDRKVAEESSRSRCMTCSNPKWREAVKAYVAAYNAGEVGMAMSKFHQFMVERRDYKRPSGQPLSLGALENCVRNHHDRRGLSGGKGT